MASGNSRTRSSISPIRLDCSIRVYLNFALRKQEKLNNLLPQFFCVYTNRHLIDTYSSFCVIAGGEIFSYSHVLLVSFFFFLLNRLRVFNHITDAVRFIYRILGQSNFALRKLSYFRAEILKCRLAWLRTNIKSKRPLSTKGIFGKTSDSFIILIKTVRIRRKTM